MRQTIQVVTTMPKEVHEKGKKAAKKMFGSDRKFSTYLQTLIINDCEKKMIK